MTTPSPISSPVTWLTPVRSASRASGRSSPWPSVAPASKQLPLPRYYAFLAGTHFMRRTHWLLKAHQTVDRAERDLCIALAKAAHRAYLNDLRRALA